MHNGYKKPPEDLDRKVKRAEIAKIQEKRREFESRNLLDWASDSDGECL